jgi:hypothetical protein
LACATRGQFPGEYPNHAVELDKKGRRLFLYSPFLCLS